MSNYLIPLMVVVPMLCAILVNAFAKFNKSIAFSKKYSAMKIYSGSN